jgi:DNA-binding beta-propeller fold protein YncE
VYVAASESEAIVIFDRAVTGGSIGLLTKKADPDGCVSETGAGPCLNGVGLDRPVAVTVSGDGRHVYAVSQTSKAVVVFDRDVATGELEQKAGTDGCVSDDGTGNACATGIALDDPFDVAVSPDGTTVLVASNTGNAVVVFTRDLVTGALTQNPGQAGCVSANGNGGDCVNGRGLVGTQAVAVAPDGRNVYSAMAVSDGVAVFTRLVPSYDVEGDGELTPLTDGVVLLRFLFGFTGAALIADAIDEVNCTRCTAAAIEAYLEALGLTASP